MIFASRQEVRKRRGVPPSVPWLVSTRAQFSFVGQTNLSEYATSHKTPTDPSCVSGRNRSSSELGSDNQ